MDIALASNLNQNCTELFYLSRFLATGDVFHTIAFNFRLGNATVQDAVYTVCNGLWESLRKDFMPVPTEQMWKKSAANFWLKWNFPNAVGAVDGKHVCIQAPARMGSAYFNYKEFFSIIIMAVADPDYCFLLVDIGEIGSQADSAVFHNSTFGKAFVQGTLGLPKAGQQLPNYLEGKNVPFVLLGDAAFPLHENLMKPFPNPRVGSLEPAECIYNYRLSCARRVIENAFGIMGQRFRIFHRRLAMTHTHLKSVVQAAAVLHNFLWRNIDADSSVSTDNDIHLPEEGMLDTMPPLWQQQNPRCCENSTQVLKFLCQ